MKRNGIILIAALVLFLAAGQTLNAGVPMTVASEQASGGEIDGSSAFTIDVYMANDGPADLCGFGLSLGFYSPDGSITDITHVDVGGDFEIPSLQYLNNFTNYLNFQLHEDGATKMDGTLPDYFNIAAAGSFCMPNTVTSTAFMRFNIEITNSTTGTTGEFCVDSIGMAESGGDGDWEWLFESGFEAEFNGPYCWTITNLVSSDVNSIQSGEVLPTEFSLGQNYPNPFNPNTTFDFALPHLSQVKIDVFNVLGQKITTLAEGEYEAGNYSVNWDGTDDFGQAAATGIYFYRMNAGDFQETKKLMLLK